MALPSRQTFRRRPTQEDQEAGSTCLSISNHQVMKSGRLFARMLDTIQTIGWPYSLVTRVSVDSQFHREQTLIIQL